MKKPTKRQIAKSEKILDLVWEATLAMYGVQHKVQKGVNLAKSKDYLADLHPDLTANLRFISNIMWPLIDHMRRDDTAYRNNMRKLRDVSDGAAGED
ncbi:hypothetical protein GC209_13920 [bacterium]|nr:hypothetical protein [bacterium]